MWSSGPLKYLLSYKFSQDHIELFFCAVRGRGGWNNNPTARQFKAAYKRLLVHRNVKDIATGNVIPQEPIELLTISSHIEQEQEQIDAEAVVEQRRITNDVVQFDHDYSDIPDFIHLSLYVDNVVVYIAGFVVRKILPKMSCLHCAAVLTSTAKCDTTACSLLDRKSRGG